MLSHPHQSETYWSSFLLLAKGREIELPNSKSTTELQSWWFPEATSSKYATQLNGYTNSYSSTIILASSHTKKNHCGTSQPEIQINSFRLNWVTAALQINNLLLNHSNLELRPEWATSGLRPSKFIDLCILKLVLTVSTPKTLEKGKLNSSTNPKPTKHWYL